MFTKDTAMRGERLHGTERDTGVEHSRGKLGVRFKRPLFFASTSSPLPIVFPKCFCNDKT